MPWQDHERVSRAVKSALVHYQQVAVERVLHIPLEAAAFGVDFKQAVDGFGLLPCCLVQALVRNKLAETIQQVDELMGEGGPKA